MGFEDKAGKYLTFVLDDRRYAFSIKNVIEIIGIQDITPVPESPERYHKFKRKNYSPY